MKFQLKAVRNNVIKVFELRHLLALHGDPLNDEIMLDGESYRLSSLIDLSGSTGGGNTSSYTQYSREITVQYAGQNEFVTGLNLGASNMPQLSVNGIQYQVGENKDFHLVGGSLRWHSHFDLEPSDRIQLQYIQ